MNSRNKKINDYILIIVIILFGLGLLLLQSISGEDGNTVVIMQNGEFLQRLSLSDDLCDTDALYIESGGGYNILEIKNGRAYITEADCPDGLCMKQKAVDRRGESLICLPHKLVITVEGETASDIDSFAY